jgi:hypothetical protein
VVGIAIDGNEVPDLPTYMKEQINEFAGRQLNIRNVTSEVPLTEDRMMLEDIDSLNIQFPNMQFLLVVWQYPVQVSHRSFVDCPCNVMPGPECDEVYHFKTTAKLKCETMLFDLHEKLLVAKAVDKFSTFKCNEVSPTFPFHTFFGLLEMIFSPPRAEYPDVEFKSDDFRPFFRPYFTNFLKDVANTN